MNKIKDIEINPMDWHNTRILNFIPDHFVSVRLNPDHADRRLEVLDWLQEHTTGRFAIEATHDEQEKRSTFAFTVNENLRIGFEDPAEATMYTMFFR